jgi:hypothetical protein
MQKNVNALRAIFSSLPAATGFIWENSPIENPTKHQAFCCF